MKTDCGNLYYNARKTAGLTQERWAELLGLSVEAVSQYERGTILPSDEVVLRMAEAAGQQIVCYWHLLNKSRVAGTVLPGIKKRPLPEAVLNLLVQVEEFRRSGLEDLKRIAADGKISGADESIAYADALEQIRLLIEAAYELQYAGKE
ncbi:MAG: helix-turn-helix transcriptional regulator [Succiniclasticum sp.]|nr:helix-turn-helix transcriptional regulator [Succiniclasticum sp.]